MMERVPSSFLKPTVTPRIFHFQTHRSISTFPARAAAFSQYSTSKAGRGSPQTGSRMILTDAMALLYRSHFAFSHDHRLRSSSGEDTTVIFGFLSTLLSLLELRPSPTHLAVVFDASGKTFRHELYPGYKGQRPEAPEEIRAAVPKLRTLLSYMNIPELTVPGVEADDIIGTLALRGVRDGMAVAIASPDKDFFQLLRQGLILLRPPKKDQVIGTAFNTSGTKPISKYSLLPYTIDDFRNDWEGLEPDQFVDLLALMGDSSDNVPGVQGIGPKTAHALLRDYGSLSRILECASRGEITQKRASTLLSTKESIAAAMLSRQLVKIQTELELPPCQVPLDSFKVRPPEDGGTSAVKVLKEMEFRMHEQRLQSLWREMKAI